MKLNDLTEIAKLAIITFIIYSVTKLFSQFKDFKLPEFKLPEFKLPRIEPPKLPRIEPPKLPRIEPPKINIADIFRKKTSASHTTTHKHVDIRELHKQHPAITMPVPSEKGSKMIDYLKKTKMENLPPNLRILKQMIK